MAKVFMYTSTGKGARGEVGQERQGQALDRIGTMGGDSRDTQHLYPLWLHPQDYHTLSYVQGLVLREEGLEGVSREGEGEVVQQEERVLLVYIQQSGRLDHAFQPEWQWHLPVHYLYLVIIRKGVFNVIEVRLEGQQSDGQSRTVQRQVECYLITRLNTLVQVGHHLKRHYSLQFQGRVIPDPRLDTTPMGEIIMALQWRPIQGDYQLLSRQPHQSTFSVLFQEQKRRIGESLLGYSNRRGEVDVGDDLLARLLQREEHPIEGAVVGDRQDQTILDYSGRNGCYLVIEQGQSPHELHSAEILEQPLLDSVLLSTDDQHEVSPEQRVDRHLQLVVWLSCLQGVHHLIGRYSLRGQVDSNQLQVSPFLDQQSILSDQSCTIPLRCIYQGGGVQIQSTLEVKGVILRYSTNLLSSQHLLLDLPLFILLEQEIEHTLLLVSTYLGEQSDLVLGRTQSIYSTRDGHYLLFYPRMASLLQIVGGDHYRQGQVLLQADQGVFIGPDGLLEGVVSRLWAFYCPLLVSLQETLDRQGQYIILLLFSQQVMQVLSQQILVQLDGLLTLLHRDYSRPVMLDPILILIDWVHLDGPLDLVLLIPLTIHRVYQILILLPRLQQPVPHNDQLGWLVLQERLLLPTHLQETEPGGGGAQVGVVGEGHGVEPSPRVQQHLLLHSPLLSVDGLEQGLGLSSEEQEHFLSPQHYLFHLHVLFCCEHPLHQFQSALQVHPVEFQEQVGHHCQLIHFALLVLQQQNLLEFDVGVSHESSVDHRQSDIKELFESDRSRDQPECLVQYEHQCPIIALQIGYPDSRCVCPSLRKVVLQVDTLECLYLF